MIKFKKGDRVKLKCDSKIKRLLVGVNYVVDKFSENHVFSYGSWRNHYKTDRGVGIKICGTWYRAVNFEKSDSCVEKATTTNCKSDTKYIIITNDDLKNDDLIDALLFNKEPSSDDIEEYLKDTGINSKDICILKITSIGTIKKSAFTICYN